MLNVTDPMVPPAVSCAAATAGLGTTTPSGTFNCSVSSWYGCSNRLGIFDAQNGIFFEFDGQTLYAGRRNSTYQIAGKVTVANGSCTVSQTNASFPTYFTKQLSVGDYIVMRGQSYRIADIASDTSLTITPGYRGTDASYVIVSKTQDTKVPQSSWNIDKCDGTGVSGFDIDFTKTQLAKTLEYIIKNKAKLIAEAKKIDPQLST